MRAVVLRVGASLRHGWAGVLAVALVVALVLGAVLTLVAGARRTGSAPGRFTDAAGGDFGALVSQPYGRPRIDEVAALPSVAALESITFVPLTIGDAGATGDGGGLGGDVNPFAGTGLGLGARLVKGRPTDPARAEEFVANATFVDLTGAQLGDHFPVQAYSPRQIEENAVSEEPAGARFEAVLVGVVETPDDLDDPTPVAVFPLSLLDLDVGEIESLIAVRFRPGASLTQLRTELDGLPDGDQLELGAAKVVSDTIRNAVDTQTNALWVLALAAGIAGVAVLGQLLGRHATVSAPERQRLAAIGASRAHLVGESMGRAAVPVVLGLAVGVGLATVLSSLFPTGFVRGLEPDPGIRFDAAVLPLGLVLAASVLGWVAIRAFLAQRSRAVRKPAPLVEVVATRVGTPLATGVRNAFTGTPRETASVFGTLVGLTLALAGVVGAVAFAISLDRFVSEPARFGGDFDVMIGNGWSPAVTDLSTVLREDPDVAGLVVFGSAAARAGADTVQVVAFDTVRGGLAPEVLAGALPASDDEVALGRRTARDLAVGVGDEVRLDGTAGTVTYRVVGLTVLPLLGNNDGVGDGALLTFDGAARVDPGVAQNVAAVSLVAGAASGTGERLAAAADTPLGTPPMPGAVRNVKRVALAPVVLAAFLAFLGLALLTNALVQSTRARRRDQATLRALGFGVRGSVRAVRWQATALVAIPILVGVPLGLGLGRIVFTGLADNIGAVSSPTTPWWLAVASAAVAVLAANVVGLIPARRVRQALPAATLRAE